MLALHVLICYNSAMTQSTKTKVYLSNPALICGAADNPSAFVHALSAGAQHGIQRIPSGLAPCVDDAAGEKPAAMLFYAGHIADESLCATNDPYDMRMLSILEKALQQLSPVVEKVKERYGSDRVGVCVGSCDNGSERSLAAHTAYFTGGAFPENYALEVQGADYPASYTAKRFGLTGTTLSFATACSSSASALIKARELILAGMCDAVIAGGVDVTSPTVLLGFNGLEAISSDITNPFSANRHGITLGEGAAFFVLSREDVDDTGMVLAGAGESADAKHMTAPLADGSGAKAAMEAALASCGLKACDIDYINLHGTGTKLNDSMEARAVSAVFASDGACTVPVSSTKPLTGHTLGAAGALELSACFLASKYQILPVHRWDGVFDGDMPRLHFVEKSDCPHPLRYCMSNSFAFGGCNTSLILHNERA